MVKQVLPGLLLEAAHSRRCYCGQALTLHANATQLGTYAAQVAQRLGVGIETEYETNTRPNPTALQQFTGGYRANEPYDGTGADPATRLTTDLALFALDQGLELRGQLMSHTGALLLRWTMD